MHKLPIKSIFYLVILIGIVVWSVPNYPLIKSTIYSSPCETPITYKIDTVDPRFKLSKTQFTQDVKKAEDLWEKGSQYNLFNLDPNGEISINLVFDERQSLTNQINSLDSSLKQGQKSLKDQEAEYLNLENAFKKKLADFNAQINYYNSTGGAPTAVYDQLIVQQTELKKEGQSLDNLARKLNKDVSTYNAQVGNLNKTVDNLSNTLEKKPEEGIYLGQEKRIEIYFNNTPGELIHTLAHELGHSLGINHNDNPTSIMYSFTSSTLQLASEDKDSLNQACRKINILEKLTANLNFLYKQYLGKL